MSQHKRKVLMNLISSLEQVAEDTVKSLPSLKRTEEYREFTEQLKACREGIGYSFPDPEAILALGQRLNALLAAISMEDVYEQAEALAHYDRFFSRN